MATRQEQFVIDDKGKKTGVIVPVKQYQKLIEDLHDLAIVAERREEETVSLDVLKSKLSKDGII